MVVRNKKKKSISTIITNLFMLFPLLLMFAVFFLYPLINVVYTSFFEWYGYEKPVFNGLQNFISLLQQQKIKISVKNNIIWAISLGFGQVGLATLTAFILARKPRFWSAIRNILFLPQVISQVAIALLWLEIYNAEHGLLNELISLVLDKEFSHSWLGSYSTALFAIIIENVLYIGYFLVIILAGVLNIPRTLYESAYIDGATSFQQDLYITLPLIRDILVTSMTLGMAYGMRHFAPTFIMTGGSPGYSTSVLGIQMYMNIARNNLGDSASLAVILILISAFIVTFMRRILKGENYEF